MTWKWKKKEQKVKACCLGQWAAAPRVASRGRGRVPRQGRRASIPAADLAAGSCLDGLKRIPNHVPPGRPRGSRDWRTRPGVLRSQDAEKAGVTRRCTGSRRERGPLAGRLSRPAPAGGGGRAPQSFRDARRSAAAPPPGLPLRPAPGRKCLPFTSRICQRRKS